MGQAGKLIDLASVPLGISAALTADGTESQLMESDGWTTVRGNVYIKYLTPP